MRHAPFVSIRALRKSYPMGRQVVHALAGVDLEMERGSFTVVMGPSGSGKSTLLHLLGGLDRPTSGEILVDDTALEKMDENALAYYRRERVGFVFQSFNLLANMDALQNVAFPLRFRGDNPRLRQARARSLLSQVGLENRLHHKPGELSGGQQQRVAIARALVNDPDLILADEPTGNLDSSSGYGIMQALSELHRAGKTVLVVTHDARIEHFATSMVYLLDGRRVERAEFLTAGEMLFAAGVEG